MANCIYIYNIRICYRQAGDLVEPSDHNSKVDILKKILEDLKILAGV